MVFTIHSQLVKDYVLLINNKRIKVEDVPDLFNLRSVVNDVIAN